MVPNQRDTLIHTAFTIDSTVISYEREIYSFFDFVSDIAGVYDFFILVLSVFFNQVSEFSYKLRVIQKIYKIVPGKYL